MDNLAGMEKTLAESTAKKKQLEEETELCSQKLERAETLIGGLGGEKVRWTESANKLNDVYTNLTGDMLISAGMSLEAHTISHASSFSLLILLEAMVRQRVLQEHGLPRDCAGRSAVCSGGL